MSAAAIIMSRRRRLVEQFRAAGATEASRALLLVSLGIRRTWIFDQMVRHGVFVTADGARFYLNERAATEFFHRIRTRALTITALLVSVFLAMWALGWLR